MASQFFLNSIFPNFFLKRTVNWNFLQSTWKFSPPNGNMLLKTSTPYQFSHLSSIKKTPKIWVYVISLAVKKAQKTILHFSLLFRLKIRFLCLEIEVVTCNFWGRVLCSLAAEDACFRMRITLGVVLIRSLVYYVCVPECSRNGSGVRPYLWAQEKFV